MEFTQWEEKSLRRCDASLCMYQTLRWQCIIINSLNGIHVIVAWQSRREVPKLFNASWYNWRLLKIGKNFQANSREKAAIERVSTLVQKTLTSCGRQIFGCASNPCYDPNWATSVRFLSTSHSCWLTASASFLIRESEAVILISRL